MSTRISSAALIALLAACSQAASDDAVAAGERGDLIECAVTGATVFSRACHVERTKVEGVSTLVIRHPDGGFRRFEVMLDGTGVISADGAQRAEVSLHGTGIEVAVGADRYRLPAKIAGDGER